MVIQVYSLCGNTLRSTFIICTLFCINKNFIIKVKLLQIQLLLKNKNKIKSNKKSLPCFCLMRRIAALGYDVRVGCEEPSQRLRSQRI